MKTERKSRLALTYCIIILATAACRKSSDQPNPNPVPAPGKLAKLEYNNGDYDSLFYNSDQSLAKIKVHTNAFIPYDTWYEFQYDINKRVAHIIDRSGERYDYVYATDQLTAVTHYVGSTKTDYRFYNYTNGKLTGIEEYYQLGPNSPGFDFRAEHELTYYADGNLKQDLIYSFQPQTRARYKSYSLEYLNYDTKVNSAEQTYFFIYLAQIPLMKNNYRKMISKDEVSGSQTVYDFEFTYDNLSNPLTKKMTSTTSGGTITVKYSYY